jgi:hypothetical protein
VSSGLCMYITKQIDEMISEVVRERVELSIIAHLILF